jgi:hypothetical protein
MHIVFNHITRMTAPRICVAGLEEATGQHVRPVTPPTDPITRALLAESGGPFEIGAMVDLGKVTPVPTAPETEDHRFQTSSAQFLRMVDPSEYLMVLEAASQTDVGSIFGRDLEQRGRGFAIESGHGSASLGVLASPDSPRLYFNNFGKLRLTFFTSGITTDVGVTDVRFYEEDQRTIRAGVVADVQRRMDQGVEVLLMLGLARAFRAAGDDRDRHWLQVNGLCLSDRPCGGLP